MACRQGRVYGSTADLVSRRFLHPRLHICGRTVQSPAGIVSTSRHAHANGWTILQSVA